LLDPNSTPNLSTGPGSLTTGDLGLGGPDYHRLADESFRSGTP
jgi:hypothetical protein